MSAPAMAAGLNCLIAHAVIATLALTPLTPVWAQQAPPRNTTTTPRAI